MKCLASELCARHGFDINAQGTLPSGGTILSVDSLRFDQALVLLTLFPEARVYASDALQGPEAQRRALSLREECRLGRPLLAAIVEDLAHARVAILSAALVSQIKAERRLLAPVRHAQVSISGPRASVLFDC